MSDRKLEFDVVVVGAGAAGSVAATQAARAGARVLLVEKTAMVGGTTIGGGVNSPGMFHDFSGRQVVRGIGWELLQRAVEEVGQRIPESCLKRPPGAWQNHVWVDRFVYPMIVEEALMEAGVELLFHAMLAGVKEKKDSVEVDLCLKTGLRKVRSAIFIDCSADANGAALAGCPLDIPEECQPGTLSLHLSGYDIDDLNMPEIDRAFAAAVAAGELEASDGSWNTQQPSLKRYLERHGANSSHVFAGNARTSEGKSVMELSARRGLLRLYRFLLRQKGLEKIKIEHLSPECGVRETARIVGKSRVTKEDVLSGRMWPDGLCHAYYPIDIHSRSPSGIDACGLPEGVVPVVPRGAMLPQGSERIIVAGRCISAEREASGTLRVQAAAMAMGQAAGAMAALSVQCNKAPEDLEVKEIHRLLREHDAIVPGDLQTS